MCLLPLHDLSRNVHRKIHRPGNQTTPACLACRVRARPSSAETIVTAGLSAPLTLRALAILASPIHADLIAMAVQPLASYFFFDFAAGAGPSAALTCSMVSNSFPCSVTSTKGVCGDVLTT